MTAYYNEIDPHAAAWLRNLIGAGLIADGEVDERSIAEVQPHDLADFTQCHFFAGIGGWSLALRLAGWSDARPVWTGSCPCQPFSVAGKGKGTADARHLWPEFQRLIAECNPPAVFGEQVASKDGRAWLAGVRADLEALGYAVGAADLCAAGIGSPHIRQRLWWMAHAGHAGHGECGRRDTVRATAEGDGRTPSEDAAGGGGRDHESGERSEHDATDGCAGGGMGDTDRNGSAPGIPEPAPREEGNAGIAVHSSSSRGAWDSYIWLPCADGKARRIEPGIEPLVDGLPGRVGRLRGYGNAIVPQVAQAFIESVMECRP